MIGLTVVGASMSVYALCMLYAYAVAGVRATQTTPPPTNPMGPTKPISPKNPMNPTGTMKPISPKNPMNPSGPSNSNGEGIKYRLTFKFSQEEVSVDFTGPENGV
ncbi:hypothetical protein [Paenibacillus sp. BC26]|uniref:hypothetical protein n=1 Tax=Paenibacillus sp. BC26 TaxID=1881032 RepID=UPI0008E2872B|nr:hypothetical protein [Paenibacillus sp. BC26]SFS70182.1 hypothetical protein SAMN05428962_2370 [Paenibacillus sp. BC26]